MTPAPANDSLDRARKAIREATAQWDAADLEKVELYCALLKAAAGDLRSFESAVQSGAIPASPELASDILQVKQEVMQATRIVDACVAFHRGLLARTGDAPPVYNAEGCIAEESAGMESEVHA